jgi:hypothetical protein
MKKIPLIVEKNKDGKFWGRVKYGGNLIVEGAANVDSLKNKMKKLLHDFHEVDANQVTFDVAYDVGVLFEQKDFLNISAIAKLANMNSSLLRQYASGVKFPSAEKTVEIEEVIRGIGRELSNISLTAKIKGGDTVKAKTQVQRNLKSLPQKRKSKM